MPASTRDHLLTMAKGKTYFGHQSVGANVLEGLPPLLLEPVTELDPFQLK